MNPSQLWDVLNSRLGSNVVVCSALLRGIERGQKIKIKEYYSEINIIAERRFV